VPEFDTLHSAIRHATEQGFGWVRTRAAAAA